MILVKRYFRNVKENLPLFLSTIFLTILAAMLFFLFYISGSGITNYQNDFYNSQKVEDATFTTYQELKNEDVLRLEEEYELILEKQAYLNLNSDGLHLRIFDQAKKVDLEKVVLGRKILNEGEILLSRGYAVQNEIKLNSDLKVKDKTYQVVGFIERPDYLYMLENLNDSYKNVSSFVLAYLHENDFKALGQKSFEYHVIYQNEAKIADFRKAINEEFILSSYLKADDNYRITMVRDQTQLFFKMAYLSLVTVPVIVLVLILIMLKRKIKSEQKIIGTLTAFGYKKWQINAFYCGYALIPGLIGGALAVLTASLFAGPFGSLGLEDYEPLIINFKVGFLEGFLALIVPSIIYLIGCSLEIHKLLKEDTTKLLSGMALNKEKHKKYLVNKNCSYKLKFSLRSIIGNFGRTFVLFLGTFIGAFVTFWGFAVRDSMLNLADSNQNSLGDYNYQYVLSELGGENPYGGESLLMGSFENEKGDLISLVGADETGLLALKNEDNESLKIDEGFIITSLYAEIYHVKIGDKLKVLNPLNLKEYEIIVKEIAVNNSLKAIYTTKENTAKMLNLPANSYNVLISEEALEIEDYKVISSISRDNINDKFKTIFELMDVTVAVFISIGLMLLVIGVYISISLVINESLPTISMLQVLGYSNKKIFRLLLNDYIYVVIIAIILSIPAGYFTCSWLFMSFVDLLGYIIEVKVSFLSVILTIVLSLLTYYLFLFITSRKINKVDLVLSLKDNRE